MKNLLKCKKAEMEGFSLILILPLIVVFWLVVFPTITKNNEVYPAFEVEGTLTAIQINYGTLKSGDSTTITLNNQTYAFNGRIPNLIIGQQYHLKYEDRGKDGLYYIYIYSIGGP